MTCLFQSKVTRSALFVFVALVANAAVANANSISVNGGGTLTFQAAAHTSSCLDPSRSPPASGSYSEAVFSNFSYTDAAGITQALTGTVTYISGDGKGSCPASSGSNITFTATDGVITFAGNSAGTGNASIALTAVTGSILPKYVVLAVTYAPPGSQSNVNYTNSTMVGTSTSLSNSFSNNTTVSTSFGGKTASLFGLTPSGGITTTASTSFTQESDTASSVALNTTNSFGIKVPGPASSAVGLSHDADVIWVWLNPAANFTINPSNTSVINWTGYSYDARDPNGEMDVIGIQVAYLDGHASIPANLASVLARSWAPSLADGSGPGLTTTDLASILTADPFASGSYTIPSGAQTTADGRFVLTGNQEVQYVPPPMGDGPITETYSVSSTTTTTQGQGGQDTRQVGFAVDINASGGFLVDFTADLKTSNNLTWTNKWNELSTQMVGQTAALSVTGPAFTDNYTGPVEFDVYQDTVYGTFMFYPR